MEAEQYHKNKTKIEAEVMTLYRNPPELSTKYPSVIKIPLPIYFKLPLRTLHTWIVHHFTKVSIYERTWLL